MKDLLRKTAFGGITLLFLLIAWATSDDEVAPVNSLPFSAQSSGQTIILTNESSTAFDSLTLILNGVYTRDNFEVGSEEVATLPLSDFKDRKGTPIDPAEAPYMLEVYYNGDSTKYSGGYSQFTFD